MSSFCVEGAIQNPKCYSVESFDFTSEEQIIDILLDLLKSELPARMQAIKDCNNKPMFIDEKDIDLIPSTNPAHLELILNPLSDVPNYSELLDFRQVEYTFEAILTVANKELRCVPWELIRFKNAVEGLIVGAEFQIDGYNTVMVEPKGFSYVGTVEEGGYYLRQGAYRFSVTVTQYRV